MYVSSFPRLCICAVSKVGFCGEGSSCERNGRKVRARRRAMCPEAHSLGLVAVHSGPSRYELDGSTGLWKEVAMLSRWSIAVDCWFWQDRRRRPTPTPRLRIVGRPFVRIPRTPSPSPKASSPSSRTSGITQARPPPPYPQECELVDIDFDGAPKLTRYSRDTSQPAPPRVAEAQGQGAQLAAPTVERRLCLRFWLSSTLARSVGCLPRLEPCLALKTGVDSLPGLELLLDIF